jgi:hypothetical protein
VIRSMLVGVSLKAKKKKKKRKKEKKLGRN